MIGKQLCSSGNWELSGMETKQKESRAADTSSGHHISTYTSRNDLPPLLSYLLPAASSFFNNSIIGSSVGKELTGNAGDTGDVSFVRGSGRFPGEGHGNPLQYSGLENSTDRGAWWATFYGVTKSWAQLRRWTHIHTHIWTDTLVCKTIDLPSWEE